MLASDALLTHYNSSLPIIVAADESKCGIESVISHTFSNGAQKVAAHASRTFIAAERNYAQTEKEALVLVLAVKKFHKFLHA